MNENCPILISSTTRYVLRLKGYWWRNNKNFGIIQKIIVSSNTIKKSHIIEFKLICRNNFVIMESTSSDFLIDLDVEENLFNFFAGIDVPIYRQQIFFLVLFAEHSWKMANTILDGGSGVHSVHADIHRGRERQRSELERTEARESGGRTSRRPARSSGWTRSCENLKRKSYEHNKKCHAFKELCTRLELFEKKKKILQTSLKNLSLINYFFK